MPLKAVIFLDFPESVFVKHADIATEKYYKQQEEHKRMKEEDEIRR